MRRRTALSIALALSVLVSLVSLPATARGQQRRVFRADTGMFILGPDQVLRLTVTTSDIDAELRVRFRRMGYVEADNVYKLAAQEVTDPVTLRPGEAVSMDVSAFTNGGSYPGMRGVVESNRQDVRVTAHIVNKFTQKVDSIIAILTAL